MPPCSGYCKLCYNQHWDECTFSNYCFLQIYSQSGISGSFGSSTFSFYKEIPQCSPVAVVIAAAQLLSPVRLFMTLWTAAHQASLSFTISQSLLIFMPIESVMLSNHLILSCPLLLLPSIFPDLWNLSHSVGWSPGITR